MIVLVAAAVPLLLARLPGPRIPEVVLFIILGIVIGPEALGIAHFGPAIDLLSNFGLGMLFFLAGFELDRVALVGRDGRSAVLAWMIAMIAALAIVGALAGTGFVRAFLPVSIALTTTALGTLLPMLKDGGELRGAFGRAMMANGAVGELFPIIAISVFLSGHGAWAALVLLAAFLALALVLSGMAKGLRGRALADMVRSGAETSSQTTVRVTVVLLVGLLLLSDRLGLDAVLGAFAAGIVLRVALPEGDHNLEHKLEGLGYGLFIPVFFVVSGMRLDIRAVLENPDRLAVFFVLILIVRAVPVYVIFRGRLQGRESIRLALYSATGLPLIVAIAEIGVQAGVMLPQNAAALVGAGLLTVIVLPVLARVIAPPDASALAPAPGAAAAAE